MAVKITDVDIEETKSLIMGVYKSLLTSYLAFSEMIKTLASENIEGISEYADTLENIKNKADEAVNISPLDPSYVVNDNINTMMDLRLCNNNLDVQLSALEQFSTSLDKLGL